MYSLSNAFYKNNSSRIFPMICTLLQHSVITENTTHCIHAILPVQIKSHTDTCPCKLQEYE